jgi:ring-1,2-phenylacetyl-CoA epoxidase subunit PaaD
MVVEGLVLPGQDEPEGAIARRVAKAWAALARVTDPEIPVLSIVDLGIVRKITENDGTLHVTITPTYSGCPALRIIESAVREALSASLLGPCVVETALAPAWTTDWMSAAGRSKLREYGIAPPAQKVVDVSGLSRRHTAPHVPCPRCSSLHTELLSQFGSTACKALYRCCDCLEPFDYFKCH